MTVKESPTSTIKYPDIKVRLTGVDGNAYSILGRVLQKMKREGVSDKERDAFMKEAMSGDYDNLLQTCMKWVDVS